MQKIIKARQLFSLCKRLEIDETIIITQVINKRTYKFIIAFIFLAIFTAETFCDVFTVAGYYLNTKAYAINCVNKDKPQLHCNGKCQLQKKLNDNNGKEKQTPERKNEAGNEVISSKTFFASVEIPFTSVNTNKYFILNNGVPVDKAFEFFHPPQSVFI